MTTRAGRNHGPTHPDPRAGSPCRTKFPYPQFLDVDGTDAASRALRQAKWKGYALACQKVSEARS